MGGYLAIDLGGTNTRVGLVGPGGILARREFLTLVGEGPEAWLARLAGTAGELGSKARGLGLPVRALGLGTPGLLDRRRRMVLSSPNLPGWVGYPLGERLEAALGLKTALENDANLHALGEFRFGAGEGHRDLVCLTLGTGVGGGLVIDRRLVVGGLGCGGELGHLTVEPEGRRCGCGARGCLEAYASATGLKGLLAEALQAGRATSLTAGAGVKEMEKAAVAGDELAGQLFATAGRALGIALNDLVAVTGLDLVVIHGGVARGWFLLEGPCRAELAARLRMADPARIQIEVSRLGPDAPLLGAAALAAEVAAGEN